MLFGEVVVQPDLGDVWGVANRTSDLELEVKGSPVPHHTHGPPLWHLEIPQANFAIVGWWPLKLQIARAIGHEVRSLT